MKKEKLNKNSNIIIFKTFEITTRKSNKFLKDFNKLCKKYSDNNKFDFRFEIEN